MPPQPFDLVIGRIGQRERLLIPDFHPNNMRREARQYIVLLLVFGQDGGDVVIDVGCGERFRYSVLGLGFGFTLSLSRFRFAFSFGFGFAFMLMLMVVFVF